MGTETGYSINEVIHMIGFVTGKKLNVQYLSGRKVDVPISILNMKRYKTLIEDIRYIGIEEGIKHTVPYISQYINEVVRL